MDKRRSLVAIARRRVADAENRVARQEQLVLRLQERKHTTMLSSSKSIITGIRRLRRNRGRAMSQVRA
jgi:hypothetical protein